MPFLPPHLGQTGSMPLYCSVEPAAHAGPSRPAVFCLGDQGLKWHESLGELFPQEPLPAITLYLFFFFFGLRRTIATICKRFLPLQ